MLIKHLFIVWRKMVGIPRKFRGHYVYRLHAGFKMPLPAAYIGFESILKSTDASDAAIEDIHDRVCGGSELQERLIM